MGIVKQNLLTKGFSGKIGDEIVFRQIGSATHFAKRPRKREVLTPGQAAHQEVFRAAIYYAKAILLDPAAKAAYETWAQSTNLKSAQIAAVTDYLKQPKIARVHSDSYQGAIGNVIFIVGEDHHKLYKVEVTIKRADGTVVETGEAIRQEQDWKYVATQANAAVAGSTIVINAKDRPGKEVTFEKVL